MPRDENNRLSRRGRMSWDEFFMSIAEQASKRSACIFPHYFVGAVFVDNDHRIISIGYSGPSRGDIHCVEEGYCLKIDGEPPTGTIKRCNGAHAEINAIINSGNTNRLKDSTLYVTLFPCYDCMKALNNAGVKRIVYLREYIRLMEGQNNQKEVEPEAMELAHKRGIILEKFYYPAKKNELVISDKQNQPNKKEETRF